MSAYLFDIPKVHGVPVQGEVETYPVHRIFCVGRNYEAHAKEMGVSADRDAPFYFAKLPSAVVLSGAKLDYPPGTSNYHYEMELVLAIGKPVFKADLSTAADAIYAYGCGLDMTRRDLQLIAREKGRPWDLGKNFEDSGVFSPLVKADNVGEIGPQRIFLAVNGEIKQDAHLSDLIWRVDEIVSDLSKYYHLAPGDLVMTGTPAGVGPVEPGDKVSGGIDELGTISVEIVDAK